MMSFVMPLTTPNVEAALRDATAGSPEARWVAAQALGGVVDENRNKAVDALYGLLSDPFEEVRAQALEGLAEQMRAGASIAVETLLGALDDPSGAVRCAAIDAAAQIPVDSTERIGELLSDSEPHPVKMMCSGAQPRQLATVSRAASSARRGSCARL